MPPLMEMRSKVLEDQNSAREHLRPWKVGALFMEAGTGKTKVARDLIATTDADVCLWIAPLRTLDNARRELDKWGGLSMCVKFVGVESLSQSSRIYLDAYAFVEEARRPFVVVDESLKIKNLNSIRTKRVLEIGKIAEYKLILNGTPLSKNLMDLYPQMNFLSTEILRMTPSRFKNTFCDYTTITRRVGCSKCSRDIITGYANIDYLYSLIRHYVYECNLNLEITQNWHDLNYQLSEDDWERYNRIKDHYLRMDTLAEWNNNIFMAMTQELQHSYCTCAGKVARLRELFSTKVDEGKSIIFCKYIDSRKFCEKAFPKAKVLSYQKEAFGLNLQEYTNTIYFDKTFDWAMREQASRRTFRVGQEYDCRYYDLTGNAGLDKIIDKNIDKKIGMVEYFKGKTKEQIKQEL